MSKKNISKTINPLPPIGKSSKKGRSKSTIEQLNNFKINDDHLQSVQKSSEEPVRLKKLRKTGDKEKQRLIKQHKQQKSSSSEYVEEPQSQSQSPQIQYEKFGKADDQDLRKMEEDKNKKKSKKKTKKGQQQIDKYVENHKPDLKKPIPKSNKPQVQTSLMAMFQASQAKKPQPATSSKMVDENSKQQNQNSSSQDQLEIYKRRKALMDAQKSIGLTQDQMLKIAVMESLKVVQNSKKQQKPAIDAYSYQMNKDKPKQSIQSKIKKTQSKQQLHLKKQQPSKQKNQSRKRQKSQGKKKQQKTQKSGKLAGLGIVLTGEFQPYSKNKILQLLQQLGADLPKSITKKTTHLLQGSFIINSFGRRTDQDVKTTTKSQQAAQKGVKIIPSDKLDDFFVEHTGLTLQQHMEKDKPKKQLNLLDRFLESNKNASIEDPERKINQNDNLNQSKQIVKTKPIANISVPWTQKYKPLSSQQIIGQNSQLKSLRQWLQIWQDIHIRGNKRDVKPNFNAFMPAGTINSNAALLSGDAGLGKTTAARLIASQFGYSIVQYNASDARNKKSVELLTIGKNNLSFMNNKQKQMTKTLIIMDQVDGMSSGDRGGITAIIDMIKKTKVPIICICNDRQATKIRSLAGHCYDIKFHKPDKRQIAKRLQKIIAAEGGKSSTVALQSIVQLLQNDIRQILTYLEVIFKGGITNINSDVVQRRCRNTKDNSLTLNHFQATKNLMNKTMFKQMTISQRIDLAYVDSDMVPLMVQQNYLSSTMKKKFTLKEFKRLTKATLSFTYADLLDRAIMRNQNYCLMPNKMFLSCVYPCQMVSQNMGFPKFTQWLGKFSTQRKNKRLIKQLRQPIACVSTVTSVSLKNHYVPMLMQTIYQSLASDPDFDYLAQFMCHYGINPVILNEHLTVLQYGQRQNLLKNIQTTKKTKLTKTFNKKFENLKFKKEKTKVVTEHHKYDPVLDQMEEQNQQDVEQQGQKQQQSQIVIDKKVSKSKPKPKKKQ